MIRQAMKPKLLPLLITLLFVGVIGEPRSAEISYLWVTAPHPQLGMKLGTLALVGEISIGDAKKIENAVSKGQKENIFFYKIEMYSNGGLASEGIKIGQTIRRLRLRTFAPFRFDDGPAQRYYCYKGGGGRSDPVDDGDPHCACASACALGWLGGVERIGSIGLHRSYLRGDGRTSNYDEMDDTLGESYAEIIAYLTEMRVPNWVADTIIETPSDELFYIDQLSGLYERDENGLFRDPVYDEYIYSRCGAQLSDEELKVFRQIIPRDRTDAETILIKFLREKLSVFRQCSLRAQFDAIYSDGSD